MTGGSTGVLSGPGANSASGAASAQGIASLIGTQLRVIRALAIRDMQSQQANLAYGFGWVFFDAFLAFAGLMVLRIAIKGFSRPGIPPITFFVSGLIPWLMFNSCYHLPDGVIRRGKNLLALPMITELDLVLASALRIFLTYTILFIVLGTVSGFYEQVPFPRFPLGIALLFIAMAVMGISFGFILMILSRLYSPASKFVGFFLRFATIFSGVVFDVTLFPPTILPYLTWNPLLHVEVLLRYYWFYTYPEAFASVSFVAASFFGLLFFGLLLERYARRRLPP